MSDNYYYGVYECAKKAQEEFPKDPVRRRQRFAELLRAAQGLEEPLEPVIAQILEGAK